MAVKSRFPIVPIKDIPAAVPLNRSRQNRPAVLVVDDESAIADTLSEILKLSGYAATPAYDAEEALETALLTPPQLLITDVVLPGMSGVELAIRMRRIYPNCQVLLFSGQAATADLLISAKRAGHQFTLLSKPVYPTDLLQRVSETLGATSGHSANHAS
jgi:CheY-like chemotaxis protein